MLIPGSNMEIETIMNKLILNVSEVTTQDQVMNARVGTVIKVAGDCLYIRISNDWLIVDEDEDPDPRPADSEGIWELVDLFNNG